MKKYTKQQEAELKAEHQHKKQIRKKAYTRLFYFILSTGNISIIAFLCIVNADVQTGHYILASFSGMSALYFIYKLIGE